MFTPGSILARRAGVVYHPRLMRATSLGSILLIVLLAGGCATTRTVTITTRPPDASLRIDGIDRGHGPITENFQFANDSDVHRVIAYRLGYKDKTVQLTKDYDRSTLAIDMQQQTRKITINVLPVAANISVDGVPVSSEPLSYFPQELQFTVDDKGNWKGHTVTCDRFGYQPKTITVNFPDADSNYLVTMDRMRKDVNISTKPDGASVYLDGTFLGTSSAGAVVKSAATEFFSDPDTSQWQPHKIKVTKPGYDEKTKDISWDNGQTDYRVDLVAKSKSVRIITDPPGAIVTLEGKELPRDANGVSLADKLEFPPDDKGQLKVYNGVAKKKTADSEWEPAPFTVAYDGGKTDYHVPLTEILKRPVPLVEAVWSHDANGWSVNPQEKLTVGMKYTDEGPNGKAPVLLTHLPKGTMIDTLDVSPDGTTILFTILTGKSRNEFHSQMMSVHTDGTGGADYLTDGKSLDLTPCFSPAGDIVAFASDRFGKKLSICTMATNGAPGVKRLTTGDNNDIWPSIDAEPSPHLFYQSMLDTRSDPRIFQNEIGHSTLTDLTQAGGMQPRISPRDDALLYTAINDKSGKHEVFRVSVGDKGGTSENLVNSPDDENYDPAWSKDGTKIAYVSERGDGGNADIYVMDVKGNEKAVQLTNNPSVDDHPVWDPTGNYIYFRSNRGGSWGIWKMPVK